MTIHEKRQRWTWPGRFRQARIWRQRRIRVTRFAMMDLQTNRASVPPERLAAMCPSHDAVEIRDVSFNYGPWVPEEWRTEIPFREALGQRLKFVDFVVRAL